MNGYVYILVNSALPNLVKIGRTTKTPNERASELSSTGVPGKFIVAYSVFVNDCVSLEKKIHDHFSEQRHSNDREFFEVETSNSINKLIELSKPFLINADSKDDDEINDGPIYEVPKNINELYQIKLFLARLNKYTFRYGVSYGEKNKNDALDIGNRIKAYLKELGVDENFTPEIIKSNYFEIYGECTSILDSLIKSHVQKFFDEDMSGINIRNYKIIYDQYTIWNYKFNQGSINHFVYQFDLLVNDVASLEYERRLMHHEFYERQELKNNEIKINDLTKKFNI